MFKLRQKNVCIGLLKNAIENTPDEGKIEVNIVRDLYYDGIFCDIKYNTRI